MNEDDWAKQGSAAEHNSVEPIMIRENCDIESEPCVARSTAGARISNDNNLFLAVSTRNTTTVLSKPMWMRPRNDPVRTCYFVQGLYLMEQALACFEVVRFLQVIQCCAYVVKPYHAQFEVVGQLVPY